jgi:hypothetical protein
MSSHDRCSFRSVTAYRGFVRFFVTGLTGNFFGDDFAVEFVRLLSVLEGGGTEPFLVAGLFVSAFFAIGFLVLGFSEEAFFDFEAGGAFDFLSAAELAGFFDTSAVDFAGCAALLAAGLLAVGGGAIFFVVLAVFAPSLLVGLISVVLDDGAGGAAFDFEDEVAAVAGAAGSFFVLAPFVAALPSDLDDATGLAGAGGGGGGGGAFGLLVKPRSLKTATTDEFLWLTA